MTEQAEWTGHAPAPGSRRAAAASAAAQGATDHEAGAARDAGQTVPSMRPVPVMVEEADGCVPRTMSLAASGVRQLVPQDGDRTRFTVIAIDQPIVICGTKELAQDAANQVATVPYPTGFYLPTGIPVVFRHKAVQYVANTSTSTATRISVAVEKRETPPPE